MKKNIHSFWIVLFFAILISAAGLRLWQYHWPTAHIVVRENELNVLVAKTPEHWYTGLGDRSRLTPFDGMLFVFPVSSRLGFVMRNMRFPLDILWFDKGKVVDIAPNVPLEPGVTEVNLRVYYPRIDANIVLEVPAGWAQAHGVVIGDAIRAVQ